MNLLSEDVLMEELLSSLLIAVSVALGIVLLLSTGVIVVDPHPLAPDTSSFTPV